jgi:hypothetical protein
MNQWNEMAASKIRNPVNACQAEIKKNTIMNKVNQGTLKLSDSELAALLDSIEVDDDGDRDSSRASSHDKVEASQSTPLSTRCKTMVFDKEVYLSNTSSLMTWHGELERIAPYFDRKGVLSSKTPQHWALIVCQAQPMHQSCAVTDGKSAGISRRQRQMNAKNTLEIDQLRRDAKIKLSVDQRSEEARPVFGSDAQQERYLRLLFEPMHEFWDIMPEELLDESLDRALQRRSRSKQGNQMKGQDRWKLIKRGQQSVGILHGKKNRSSLDHSTSTSRRQGETGSGSSILTNEQRAWLLSIFQRYTMRVSGGTTNADLMARSTWFRFLSHCGILGPDPENLDQAEKAGSRQTSCDEEGGSHSSSPGHASGGGSRRRSAQRAHSKDKKGEEPSVDYFRKGGVSFSHASAVYNMYAEVNTSGPPALSFSTWVNAIQHILRGPNFYRTHKEVVLNLFGVCLKRCDIKLGVPHSEKMQAKSRQLSMDSTLKSTDMMQKQYRRSLGRTTETLPPMPDTPDGNAWMPPLSTTADPGVLGWQTDLAEEQMCEPEVLLLLHEHEDAFYAIFEHYATERKRPEGRGKISSQVRRESTAFFLEDPTCCSEIEQEEPVEHDTDTTQKASLPLNRQRRDVMMDPGSFRFMVHDLGLFPGVVQLHSVQQHLDISLSRRESIKLSYQAFVECLLRIAFVYLSIYGNNVQQAAFSKAKCVWLITLLRVRCNELMLPGGLSAEEEHGVGRAWQKKDNVNLDTMPLDKLVLWPAMDADVGPLRTRRASTSFSMASRPDSPRSMTSSGVC